MRDPKGLNKLKAREEKCWKVMDWLASDANKDLSSKQKAVEFVLKRLYPEKSIIAGDADNPLQGLLHVYIPEINGK